MKNLFNKIFGIKQAQDKQLSRAELEMRVEKGTQKAVKEYGEVFHKLAEFDKV